MRRLEKERQSNPTCGKIIYPLHPHNHRPSLPCPHSWAVSYRILPFTALLLYI
jgi:hypothetical protein